MKLEVDDATIYEDPSISKSSDQLSVTFKTGTWQRNSFNSVIIEASDYSALLEIMFECDPDATIAAFTGA